MILEIFSNLNDSMKEDLSSGEERAEHFQEMISWQSS